MSVLDLVEKQADAMLRRLDWENVNTTTTCQDVQTPSVLKEVDAMAEEPNQTEIPVVSLDAVLEADSDASLQLSSDDQPLAKNIPIPVENEIIEVSDTSVDSPIAGPASSEDSDDIPIAALEKKQDLTKESGINPSDNKDPQEVPISDMKTNEKLDHESVSSTESEESSSDELLVDLLSQRVLLAWEKHRETVSKSEPTEVTLTPMKNKSEVQPIRSPNHSPQVKLNLPSHAVAQQLPVKDVSPILNPALVKPTESEPSVNNVIPVKEMTLYELPPGRTDPTNTSLGTSEIKEDSLSTNSNSMIPVVTSSFSALEASTHSPSGEEAFKPSPLTREEIDRLFPRVASPQQKNHATPDPKGTQGIVCPLCLVL